MRSCSREPRGGDAGVAEVLQGAVLEGCSPLTHRIVPIMLITEANACTGSVRWARIGPSWLRRVWCCLVRGADSLGRSTATVAGDAIAGSSSAPRSRLPVSSRCRCRSVHRAGGGAQAQPEGVEGQLAGLVGVVGGDSVDDRQYATGA